MNENTQSIQTDHLSQSATRMEPLLLVHDPRNEYKIGQFITVDGNPAVIRSGTDTGTVLHAQIEVYESREARKEANR